jgi:hypothetical protein
MLLLYDCLDTINKILEYMPTLRDTVVQTCFLRCCVGRCILSAGIMAQALRERLRRRALSSAILEHCIVHLVGVGGQPVYPFMVLHESEEFAEQRSTLQRASRTKND